MAYRTCPKCGYKYKPKEFYVKVYPKSINHEWQCTNCKTKLSFNLINSILLLFIKFIPVLTVNKVMTFAEKTFETPFWLNISIYVILSILWIFGVSLFSKFVVVKNKKH